MSYSLQHFVALLVTSLRHSSAQLNLSSQRPSAELVCDEVASDWLPARCSVLSKFLLAALASTSSTAPILVANHTQREQSLQYETFLRVSPTHRQELLK